MPLLQTLTAASRARVSLHLWALCGLLLTSACHSNSADQGGNSDAATATSTTAESSGALREDELGDLPDSAQVKPKALAPGEVRELDWMELMPADELEALQQAPMISHDGMFKPLQEGSFRTVPEMDGQHGKIPGYIVPIETDADGKLTEFFLVPYFGACIHVPPPPPNQIIHGRLANGIEMTDIYAAYWIEGTLKAERFDNDVASTAYVMAVDKVYLWE